ncbi:MAG: metal ABC transporter permease [Candidatus Bathyarchaeota archaeon]
MVEALIFSLIVGVVVGFSAGYIGSIMVLEKMALVGDALSHVALPGLALGILFNFNPFFGAFASLFTSAVIIWYLGRITKLSFETLVGAVFTLALAIGILLVPQPEMLEALFGDISNVNMIDAITALAISITVVSMTRIIYKKIVLGLISEELAVSKGINVAGINLLYLLLVSLTVAIGIKITGTLLVGFLVVTPAAAAKTISSNLSRYFALSSIFGAISSTSGILLSRYFNILPGPLVVLSGVTIFVAVVLMRWRMKITT